MFTSLSRLLRRRKPPAFNVDEAVGRYLLDLPRCPAEVVVCSPKYDPKHYWGEVIADAKALLPWAEHHASAVMSLYGPHQAARFALPIWLRGTEPGGDPAYLPEPFVSVVSPYRHDFIEKGIARVTCSRCSRTVTRVGMQKLDKVMIGATTRYTEEWRCDEGHLIYRENHEIRFFFARTTQSPANATTTR